MLTEYKNKFLEYIDSIAIDILSDNEFELEYQGLYLIDKLYYLSKKGKNLFPLFKLNVN